MSDVAISVRELSKHYRIGAKEKQSDTFLGALKNMISAPFRNYRQIRNLTSGKVDDESIFWALRQVSFDVNRGDVLGIIGHNGAGKSTLLKILSRITDPSSGEVIIKGRVSSLLEVGTGFHPELTGRENVYMNGTILGMTRKEIDGKFNVILEFSGIEKHIDTPVKFFSSGMKVRLAFSVAAHLDPEVLIIDEVLAVGDTEFQSKCLGKLNEVAGSGRTILFVSHDMGAIQNLCSRALLLENGQIKLEGTPTLVIENYLSNLNKNKPRVRDSSLVTGKIHVLRVSLLNNNGQEIQNVLTGQPVSVRIQYGSDVYETLPPYSYFHIFFKSIAGANLFVVSTKYSNINFDKIPGKGHLTCHIDSIPLLAGSYLVDVAVKIGEETEDLFLQALGFQVEKGSYNGYARLPNGTAGSFVVNHNWA